MAYEDDRVIAVPVGNMHTAVSTINLTESARLLLHIVPTDDGFWLIYKADAGLEGRLAKLTPGLKVISPRS